MNLEENQNVHIEDLNDSDIKINPDFYIHRAILKAQDSLIDPSIEQGLLKYRIIIEHAETLARSSKMLDETYKENLTQYVEEIKKDPDQSKESIKILIAHKKLELILDAVFKNKTITGKISL